MGKESPYYTDHQIKEKIDHVLHINAMLMQNLGIDSSKADRQAAKVQERKNLREIKDLDPLFIEPLIKED